MYQYRLKIWEGDEQKVSCGLVAGNTYQEAMDNLMKYAEGEYIAECTLQELGIYDNILTYEDSSFDISKYLVD